MYKWFSGTDAVSNFQSSLLDLFFLPMSTQNSFFLSQFAFFLHSIASDFLKASPITICNETFLVSHCLWPSLSVLTDWWRLNRGEILFLRFSSPVCHIQTTSAVGYNRFSKNKIPPMVVVNRQKGLPLATWPSLLTACLCLSKLTKVNLKQLSSLAPFIDVLIFRSLLWGVF